MIRLTDILNENRPPTPKDVKNWIESFNNAVYLKRAAGYFLFRGSKFAIEGIKRELKDADVRVTKFPKNTYGIPESQKDNFHWGTNESSSGSIKDESIFSMKREKVKKVTVPESKDYYAEILKGPRKFEIQLGSYRGLTNYLINTKKEARSLKEAEKIAKEWLKSYIKNPK